MELREANYINDRLVKVKQLISDASEKAIQEGLTILDELIFATCNRPVDERYLEVVTTTSSTSKVTVASKTGRVTLKISDGASKVVADELTEFVKEQIMPYQFKSNMTYRGRIQFDKHKQCYVASMGADIPKNRRTIEKYFYSQEQTK